jgi:transcriptional regulator with XRE-family HTH domain
MSTWKPSHKSRGVNLPSFAEALRDAREQAEKSESALAKELGVSDRTVQRWELAEAAPSSSLRPKIAGALLGATYETWEELVDSLGLSLDAMRARYPDETRGSSPPSAPSIEAPGVVVPAPDARKAMDESVRALAEHLDVTARHLRLAFATLLADVERLGLSPGAARQIVLQPTASSEPRSVPRPRASVPRP